jgi:hypothetical protein
MSIGNFNNNSTILQVVIIKGFMNRPTKLNFVKRDRKTVVVRCRDDKKEMNFANDMVYQYDAEVYQRLQEAFNSNDMGLLEREWQRAMPINAQN